MDQQYDNIYIHTSTVNFFSAAFTLIEITLKAYIKIIHYCSLDAILRIFSSGRLLRHTFPHSDFQARRSRGVFAL